MIKKSIKKNIDALKNLRDSKRGKIPNTILGKVNNIVELYEQRKSFNYLPHKILSTTFQPTTPRKEQKH